ncbi:MAG TPA: PH domain-containing protein [Verrucomicrobiota bacterium]|nr:PH domain-containing protein [Verrucomicrobiota bacterium]HNU53259.1 PH domain-containing protein [Verrucomicrobiota bacterium]
MALIDCPECGKQVSTAAQTCPHCGFPMANAAAPPEPEAEPDPTDVLAEARPSWWGFFWHLLFFWLLVPLFVAWWCRASVVLRIYRNRIVIERGIFSKSIREFMVSDIRAIDIDQTFWGRLVGVGDLTVSTAATTDASERLNAIPDPLAIRDLILAERRSS